jgi:YVTN family beta-propeller protein
MIRQIAAALLAGLATSVAWAGPSNSLMDISADGSLMACGNRDAGTVAILDLKSNTKVREIPVGLHPEGVTFVGPTHNIAVAVYGEDVIKIASADSGELIRTVSVFDEPYGLVSTKDGARLFATLDYPGQILEIDPEQGTILHEHPAGQFLRGLALSTDEKILYATEYYTGIVKSVDRSSGKVIEEFAGSEQDNLARQITVHPTRPKAYVPHIRSRITVAQGEGSIFPYVSMIDLTPVESTRRRRVQMDSFRGTYVVANPSEVAISPDGERMYIVFGGTDDMFVCDVLDDNYREIKFRQLIQLGANPRAVKVSADGSTFYVYNSLDYEVVSYDASTFQPTARIPTCKNPLDEETWLGKRMFYLAKQPMVGLRWISCSSCHPDGDADGRTWQQPEGLRQTQPLGGLAWTHPLHWSADRDEVQDFEHSIRGPLMQGRGLIRGRVHDALGKPNSGLSKELDAMAVYTNSHKFSMSPHSKSGLSEAALRGQKLFQSAEVGCAKCHSGPYFCDSRPGEKFAMHDVGTGKDDPTEKMEPKYDTPTLLGLYRSAPYLHHGKAESLGAVLTTWNKGDQHGKTSQLKPNEIDDLVEFLKALPFEDPQPAAEAAGLKQVTK